MYIYIYTHFHVFDVFVRLVSQRPNLIHHNAIAPDITGRRKLLEV